MKNVKLSLNNRGFTLVEIMVVVIIIGALAAVSIPQYAKQSEKAKIKVAIADIQSIKTAIDLYIAEEGYTPTAELTGDGAEEYNLQDVLDDAGINWTTIVDPWGKGYRYAVGDAGYTIASSGPDREFTGASVDDIVAAHDSPPQPKQQADAVGENIFSGTQ